MLYLWASSDCSAHRVTLIPVAKATSITGFLSVAGVTVSGDNAGGNIGNTTVVSVVMPTARYRWVTPVVRLQARNEGHIVTVIRDTRFADRVIMPAVISVMPR